MKLLCSFEGPDMTGKTQIAKELSRQLEIPYFKNSGEWSVQLKDSSYFKNLLVFGGTFLIDFINQVRPNVILDRHYPSEWVYSRAFNRETDEEVLRKIDEKFAEAGGRIIICRRKSYEGIKDDLHDHVDSQVLKKIDAIYEDFTKWTKCRTLTVWVDDEDLNREVNEIKSWLDN
jgi:thymidylate kinase